MGKEQGDIQRRQSEVESACQQDGDPVADALFRDAFTDPHGAIADGRCDHFSIYEDLDNGKYRLIQKREVKVDESLLPPDLGTMKCGGRAIVKSDKLSDCRAVICSEIGFKVRKNLNSRGISVFDIEGPIDPIIRKIIGLKVSVIATGVYAVLFLKTIKYCIVDKGLRY